MFTFSNLIFLIIFSFFLLSTLKFHVQDTNPFKSKESSRVESTELFFWRMKYWSSSHFSNFLCCFSCTIVLEGHNSSQTPSCCDTLTLAGLQMESGRDNKRTGIRSLKHWNSWKVKVVDIIKEWALWNIGILENPAARHNALSGLIWIASKPKNSNSEGFREFQIDFPSHQSHISMGGVQRKVLIKAATEFRVSWNVRGLWQIWSTVSPFS